MPGEEIQASEGEGTQVSEQPFSIADTYSRLSEEFETSESAETEIEPEDSGPSEEGELLDDEGETQETDEGEEEDLEADDPTDDELDPATSEETLDPEDGDDQVDEPSEIDTLRAEFKAMQDQNEQLLALIQQGQPQAPPQQAEQPQQPRQTDPALLDSVALLIYGQDTTQDRGRWDAIPETTKNAAKDLMTHYRSHQARAILDPQYRFETEIKPFLDNAVQDYLRPLQQDLEDRRLDSLTEPYQDQFKDPEFLDAVCDILNKIPNLDQMPFDDRKTMMKIAVNQVDATKSKKQLAKEKQKVRSVRKQQEANKGKRRRGSRGGRRNSTSTHKQRPKRQQGQSLTDYAEMLEDGGYDLSV